MTLEDPNSSDDLRRCAVHWLTRIQSGDATHEELDACAAWRRADPEHDRVYRSVEFFWEASRHLPEKKLRSILAQGQAAQSAPRQLARRRFGLGVAGACVAATAAVMVLPVIFTAAPQYEASVNSRDLGSRETVLPDGSSLNLNVGTQLHVALYDQQRVVELTSGEVFLSVQPDPARPFIVKAGGTVVTVTGTRFNVRRDASQVKVAVESGSVSVSAGRWWNKTNRNLTAGQTVNVGADGEVSSVAAANIANVTAWREGKIVFDNAPLEYAVSEINRYLPHPAKLDAPRLRDYRVAGVFSINDPESMLAALPAIAPVRLQHQPDGRVQILPR